jgi:hypothetical protein
LEKADQSQFLSVAFCINAVPDLAAGLVLLLKIIFSFSANKPLKWTGFAKQNIF